MTTRRAAFLAEMEGVVPWSVGVERMLHLFLAALVDLGREPVPDETTVCRFRHLLEGARSGPAAFDEVQRHLAVKGLKVATGTIVDATIINAPSSTKNASKARDPEMNPTKKGDQWYFGMRHISGSTAVAS
jgi:IS5 family transposase